MNLNVTLPAEYPGTEGYLSKKDAEETIELINQCEQSLIKLKKSLKLNVKFGL